MLVAEIVMTPRKKSTEPLRSGTLNMRISPRLLYLAKIAARYQDITLSSFLENAITAALVPERVFEDDAMPGTEVPAPKAALPLWGDGLWDEDEATRFFLLAIFDSSLLNTPQSRLWTLLSGSLMKNKGKITLRDFKEYYYSSSIDTKHLQIEEEE
jgi:hypothetical protein